MYRFPLFIGTIWPAVLYQTVQSSQAAQTGGSGGGGQDPWLAIVLACISIISPVTVAVIQNRKINTLKDKGTRSGQFHSRTEKELWDRYQEVLDKLEQCQLDKQSLEARVAALEGTLNAIRARGTRRRED